MMTWAVVPADDDVDEVEQLEQLEEDHDEVEEEEEEVKTEEEDEEEVKAEEEGEEEEGTRRGGGDDGGSTATRVPPACSYICIRLHDGARAVPAAPGKNLGNGTGAAGTRARALAPALLTPRPPIWSRPCRRADGGRGRPPPAPDARGSVQR